MPTQDQNRTIVIEHRRRGVHRALNLPGNHVHSLFDKLIHEAWCCRQFIAAMDVLETGQEYFIEIELPGVEAGSIRVHLNGRQLTIEGTKKLARPKNPFNAHLSERCEGDFSRTLRLPEAIEPDRVEQFLRDGVLYLKIRKTPKHPGERTSL